MTEGKRLCAIFVSDEPAVLQKIQTVTDGHTDRLSVDAVQKVNTIVCDIYNDPSFAPADTVASEFPELRGDPSKRAIYHGTNTPVYRDKSFLADKFNEYRKEFTIVYNNFTASGSGQGGNLSGGNLASFIQSGMNENIIKVMYETLHKKPTMLQFVTRVMQKEGRAETDLGGDSNAAWKASVPARGTMVPQASGHGSRKKSAATRRAGRAKKTLERERSTVADVAADLAATTERNSTMTLLIAGQQAGLLNDGMNAELKRKLEAIGRVALQGEPDSDEQASDDDDDHAGWSEADEDEDDATVASYGTYDVEWLDGAEMREHVAAAEADAAAAAAAPTAATAATTDAAAAPAATTSSE
jgi:hypothetical protein